MMARDAILPAKNLRKRKIAYVSRFYTYKQPGEDVKHLPVYRWAARQLWWAFLNVGEMTTTTGKQLTKYNNTSQVQ